MPLLLAKLPSEDALQRLLDAETVQEVAREPDTFFYVIDDDGTNRQVLAEEPR
jgi:hypothetical protein